MEPRSTVPKVPSPVITSVLNMYLDNGIVKSSMMVPRSKKLFSVGFSTVSFGGYIKISENGLNALVRV